MTFKNVYGGRHATRAAAKIAQRVEYAFTQPAQLVRKEIIALGYGCQIEKAVHVGGFDFKLDLFIKEYNIDVETDGLYHLTKRQEKKAAWRDALLLGAGYKVLRIDAYYVRNAEWLSKLRVKLSDRLMKMKRGELQEAKID